MDLHWDYEYYQPWTDNKWLIQGMLAMNSKADEDNANGWCNITTKNS